MRNCIKTINIFVLGVGILALLIISQRQARAATRINPQSDKVKVNVSGFAELGYYMIENQPDAFKIENAGISLTGEKSDLNLNGILEIQYSDKSDSFFRAEQIFLNKAALMINQKNGGLVVGKFNNLCLPRQSDVNSRKTLGLNMIDNILGRTNPIGLQYYITLDSMDLNLGIYNAGSLIAAPVGNLTSPRIRSLCLNYDGDNGASSGKRDIFLSAGFKSGVGLKIRSGYMTGKLASNDILYLQNIAPGLADDKRDMWFAGIEQISGQMFFGFNYYNLNISSIKNKLMEFILSYKLQSNINAAFAYSNSKYKTGDAVLQQSIDILSDKKQYIISLYYDLNYLTVGYEYSINKENIDSADFPKDNNLQVIKAIYKF